MPGRIHFENTTTSATSPFALFRTVSAADTMVSQENKAAIAGVIQLGQPPGPAENVDDYRTAHAFEHAVLLSGVRTAGAGDLVVTPFVQFSGSISSLWLQLPDITLVHEAAPVLLTVPFCKVKLGVKTIAGGATWQIHESHSID